MTYPNGQIPPSALRPIAGGGFLLPGPAAGWNAMAAEIYARTGVKIAPNGSLSSYRDLDGQKEMKAYWCARGLCGNAADPGTSNHGKGDTVDTDDHELVEEHGAPFGFQKEWSDASWEPWHERYQPGHYDGPDPGPDYGPVRPPWWQTVGHRIRAARKRRLSKKARRRATESRERKATLHRQIQKLGDLIKRLVKRRKSAS